MVNNSTNINKTNNQLILTDWTQRRRSQPLQRQYIYKQKNFRRLAYVLSQKLMAT